MPLSPLVACVPFLCKIPSAAELIFVFDTANPAVAFSVVDAVIRRRQKLEILDRVICFIPISVMDVEPFGNLSEMALPYIAVHRDSAMPSMIGLEIPFRLPVKADAIELLDRMFALPLGAELNPVFRR